MPIIKLLETHYIDTDVVGEAILVRGLDRPLMSLHHKNEQQTHFHCAEATEAWANWTAYFDGGTQKEGPDEGEV